MEKEMKLVNTIRCVRKMLVDLKNLFDSNIVYIPYKH